MRPQVVTCSGVFHDGSLRIVRSGIGINEQATVELQGIRGVWSLRKGWLDAYDTYLVLSFVGETRWGCWGTGGWTERLQGCCAWRAPGLRG